NGRISMERLRSIIIAAIESANRKSSRAILNIADEASEAELRSIYLTQGRALFKFFVKYCGDPASTAYDCVGRHFSDVALEQFRNRTLQKERMNSGWRYQYMAKDCALASERFESVSDIGATEADFNIEIARTDKQGEF